MDQRHVKPVFWPVLILSCVALGVMTFFLIAGMISSRGEDYFIVTILGLILFVIARTVQANVAEPPKMAIVLMFGAIVLAVIVVVAMNHALVHSGHVTFVGTRMHPTLEYMPRGLRWLGSYRQWASSLTAQGFDLSTHRDYSALLRAIHLSYGIIAGIAFIVLQVLTCVLLFVGTKPKAQDFRH